MTNYTNDDEICRSQKPIKTFEIRKIRIVFKDKNKFIHFLFQGAVKTSIY